MHGIHDTRMRRREGKITPYFYRVESDESKSAHAHTQLLSSVVIQICIQTRTTVRTALTHSDIEVLRAQHLELLRSSSLVDHMKRFQGQATGGLGALRYLRTRTDRRSEPRSGVFADTDDSLPRLTACIQDIFRQERIAPDAPTLDSVLQSFPALSQAERQTVVNNATPQDRAKMWKEPNATWFTDRTVSLRDFTKLLVMSFGITS